MVKVKEDLTGMTFGRLAVIEQTEDCISTNGTHQACWLCQCECGSDPVIVWGKNLKNKHTTSCGCYHKQRVIETHKKINHYEFRKNYVVGYTFKGEEFYIDISDYHKISEICWYMDDEGYIIGGLNGKLIKMHRYIVNCPDDMVVDHIGGDTTRYDNRRFNLRICTSGENARNQKIDSRSQSECTGVTWDKKLNKWIVRLQIKGKRIWVGSFDSIDDAIVARKKAENKYFGEWSYGNSQKQYKEKLDEINREDMVI